MKVMLISLEGIGVLGFSIISGTHFMNHHSNAVVRRYHSRNTAGSIIVTASLPTRTAYVQHGYIFYLLPTLLYVSRLMLLPNLAYSSTFSSCIPSLIVPSFSSNTETSSSILAELVVRSSCTSGRGREMKESPIW